MKQITYYIIPILLSLLTVSAKADDTPLSDKYTKERPVIIACDWDKAPYEFLDNSGQPAGSNIDIIQAIMKELALPCRFVMKEWGNAIATFGRGDADLILANVHRYNKEPYYATENIINYNRIRVAMLKNDTVSYITQSMLENEPTAFKPGDYAAKYFISKDSIRASRMEFQSPKVALTGIVAGDRKYFVWGEEPLKWKIRELNLKGIMLCDVSIPISEIHIIGRDKKLIEEIDDHYSRLMQSGEIERLRNRWFHPEREKVETPPIAIYTIVVIMVLTLLFYLFYRLAKRKVRNITSALSDVNNIMDKALQMGKLMENVYETDHKAQLEQAYHELEWKYQALFNTPIICMSFYSKAGLPIVINDAMREMCNLDQSANEHFWQNVSMFDMPLVRSAYSPNERDDLIICQHMDYPEFHIDKRIEFHIHPILNDKGEITSYFNSCIDVTDERERHRSIQAQEKKLLALNEQINKYEELLRYVLDHGKMVVWRGDFTTRTIQYARSLKKSEFTETFDEYLDRMDIDQRYDIQQVWRQDHMTSRSVETLIHFNYMPDKDEAKWIISTGIPIRNEEGMITGYFGINRDVTDLLEAQEQLRQEKSRAENSGRNKSLFLASMTHEIRTPLNSIVGFSDLLHTAETPEEHQEFIRMIRSNCDMLLRLINDILEASSLSNEPLALTPVDVDFAKLFNEICHMMEQRVQPPVAFIAENPYSTFPTNLDKGRIQQVITNFVTNAVKHTKEGHIKVGYRYESRGLYIYCEDTGSGIPKDQQEAIFERFVKLDEFTQGTGLGLNICQSIARQCKGKIGVQSEGQGKGSTFWFWIPCKKFDES